MPFFSAQSGLDFFSRLPISVMTYSKSLFWFVKYNAMKEGFHLDYEIKMFDLIEF